MDTFTIIMESALKNVPRDTGLEMENASKFVVVLDTIGIMNNAKSALKTQSSDNAIMLADMDLF